MVHHIMDKGASLWVLIEAAKLELIKPGYGYIDGSKLVGLVRHESFEYSWAYNLVVAR